MSCTCWDDTKIDQQAIDFELPSETQISRIEVWQGLNEWAMPALRLHCAGADGSYDTVLEVNVSLYHTVITCSNAGCTVTKNPPEEFYCGEQRTTTQAASAGSSPIGCWRSMLFLVVAAWCSL
eukprot:Skav233649  [mRNA]  locus=scaffold2779:797112:803334:- [translate_table: standard]